ncbi:MAG: flagellar biosynthetic protein FliO [Deltaproteobacteria bacterium]|nr:flagellar biosynthetic protein FliO [Deltaproteobacteria bacterium]
MFAIFQRQPIQQRVALPNFGSVAQYLMRWLASSKRRASGQSLQVLESVALTPHASLALVRFESDTLVLGVTAQSVRVLTKTKNAEGVVSAAEAC